MAESSSTDLEVDSAIGIPSLFIKFSAKPTSSRQFANDAYLLSGLLSLLNE